MAGHSRSAAPSRRLARPTVSSWTTQRRAVSRCGSDSYSVYVTPSWGHRLFVELPQPARGLSLRVDYTNTFIAEMMINDTVAATQVARMHRSPKAVSSRVVSLDMPGWLLAKAGFAVTWTLESELPHDAEHREAA